MEGSRGIYRPIRGALMMQLLSLQQKKQIPSWVTAEDMIELILEKSKRTLRDLWEFELEGFDEDEAMPLLTLLLSKLSVGVAKATLDHVFHALITEGSQANFTRSIRDDMVLSILTEIRQTWPHDILVNSIKNFDPVLLTEIADVTMRLICEMFEPRSPEVPAPLTSQAEMPAAISEEQQINNPEINSAEVQGPLSYPPVTKAKIQAREDGNGECILDLDPKTSFKPSTAALTNLMPHPAEPAAPVQAREDAHEEASLDSLH
ncbi:hypothetical protein INR49_032861 [Caranx melampygus]|nr:hypothetical protein INR49_032861 [Caranx melampygus]